MKKLSEASIRNQLLFWLLIPLLAVWLITAFCTYLLAQNLAYKNFDRELLNSADSIIARLKSNPVKIWVDMPAAAQAVLRHDNTNKIFYQVLKFDGTRLSGDAFLPKPVKNIESLLPTYRFSIVNGEEVRIVRVRVIMPGTDNQEVMVQVAMTLNSLKEETSQILLCVLIPQIVCMFLSALSVSYGIKRGLISLTRLEHALLQRSPLDLTPVEGNENPSEIKPLVTALNALLLCLKEDIEQQKRFVANAAHQFRTPLAGLKTYIYAAKKISNDSNMQKMLEKIESGTDRMTHLSNKLLILAKAEPRENFSSNEVLDLNFIASEITAELVAEAVVKNINLGFIGSQKPALIRGNTNDLAELLSNLIENAILYTPGGGDVAVSIANGNNVKLIVQDNGPGIAKEEREKVFERFYRLLGNNVEGSGLGLSIVKEIAAAHNGGVSIADDYAQGTKVIVTFPCIKAEQNNRRGV